MADNQNAMFEIYSFHKTVRLTLGLALICCCQSFAFTQKPNKFPDAIERSGDAARIVSMLALLPDSWLS